MPFEKFESNGRGFTPVVSITTTNMIGFNQGAVHHYKLKDYSYALIYFDKELNRIGVTFTNDPNEKGTKNLRHRKSGGADVSAKAFFDYHGIDVKSVAKKYIPEHDNDNNMIIFTMTNKE